MLNPFARKPAASAADAAAPNPYQAKCLEALKTADGALDLVNRLDAEISSMASPMNPRGRMWRRQREEATRVHRCYAASADVKATDAAYHEAKNAAEIVVKERRKAVVAAARATSVAEESLARINARTAPLIEAAQLAKRKAEQQLQQAEDAAQSKLEAAELAGDDAAANEASVALAKAREQRALAGLAQSPEALRVETLQRHAQQAQAELEAAQRAEEDHRIELAKAEDELASIELDRQSVQYLLACAKAVAAARRVPAKVRRSRKLGWAAGEVVASDDRLMPLSRAAHSARMDALVQLEEFAGPNASVFEVDPLTLPAHNDDAQASVVTLDPQPRAAA